MRFSRLRTKIIQKDNDPYIRRWYIIDSDRIGLMLHNICRPDADRYLHDHPWWFVSLVLRGSYVESYTNRRGQVKQRRVRWLNFKPLSRFHRIESIEPNTWTLVLTGPKYREWAYRVPFTEMYDPEGWVSGS